MKRFFKNILNLLPDKSDFFLLSGVGSIFWGVYQIHIPISFIVTGILLSCIGLINAIPSKKVLN